MSLSPGRLVLSCLLLAGLAGPAFAQSAKSASARPATAPARPAAGVLASERAKNSYMVGMDVGRSIAPVGPDLDLAAFERALRNGFAGGKPLLGDAETKAIGTALMQRIQARKDPKPGVTSPAVAKDKVGLLVGSDVGRSLAPIASEIDVPVMLGALKTMLAGGKPLLSDTEADTIRKAFVAQQDAKVRSAAQQAGAKNEAEGAAFLAKNRQVKGVFVTPSGLQYMVLRQGAGRRPLPSDKVRVNYQGTLLDGTVFDSSYERGQPAEFALGQVIKGWTEGVGLMPIGAKYRFWIPGNLAYGAGGTPGGPIGPNATLVFDVELLDIL